VAAARASTWLALFGPALVLGLAATGLAWRECLLLAAAGFAVHRLLLWRLHAQPPMEAWRAGVHHVFAGLGGLLAGSALVVVVAAAASGFFEPSHARGNAAVELIVVSGLLMAAIQPDGTRRLWEAAAWSVLVSGSALALAAAAAGHVLVPCALVASMALYLGWRSWSLARGASSGLLRSGQRP
jgi:hypothetical protein